MTWRPAASITTLLNEINAAYPGRSKATDGIISGYPGSRSSHQVNSAGVVCAIDITTGQGSSITMAQGEELANHIRRHMQTGVRGFHAYVIFNRRIAHHDVGWEWAPYSGADAHTSHIHVSTDWDILEGGKPSGLCAYDSTASWGIASVASAPAPQAAPAPAPAPAAPAAPRLFNRTVTVQGTNVRTGPGTGYAKAPGYEGGLNAGAVIAVLGYNKGQAVTPGNDAWYRTKSGYFVWANNAQDDISGLPYFGEYRG